MIETYLALGAGATIGVAQYIYEQRLENRFLIICDENKKAFERLMAPEKMSRLAACLTHRNK